MKTIEWIDKIWEVDKENSKEHWLELKDPNGWHSAVCKWDGCIHYHKYGNIPLEVSPDRKDKDCCDDYIHICNIDDHIERLLELKRLAQEHFKDHHYFKESWGRSK